MVFSVESKLEKNVSPNLVAALHYANKRWGRPFWESRGE